jgi:hypothetical protein
MKRSWSSLLTVSLLSGSFAVVGCGGDTPPGGSNCATPSTGMNAQAVANTLKLPMTRSDYAFDIDGNGSTENQLGNIVGALATMGGLNPQDSVDKAIAAGGVVLLLDENAADLTNNDCASVTISSALATMAAPKYDGTDKFTKDPALSMGGVFKGKFAAGTFTSNNPVTSAEPTTVTVQLPLVSGSAPIKLTVVGARIQFKRDGDKITGGVINGAITSKAVDADVIPSVADLLSSNIAKDPTSSTNMQIASIFDTGGGDDGGGCKSTKVCGTTAAGSPTCKNPDGTCADACDGKIAICEVKNNNIIKNVLSADVQLFDDAGNWKPNPAKTKKDSLSLGLSFTGVKASF